MELCTKCSIYIFKWIYLLAMCMHCVFSIEICIFFEILKIWLKCAATYKVFLWVPYFSYCCSFHYWKVQFYDVWIKMYTSFLFILMSDQIVYFWKYENDTQSLVRPHQINLKTLVHGILSNISDSQEKETFCKDHPMAIYFPMYYLIKIEYLLDLSLNSYCHHSVPVVCPYTWNLV